MPCLIGCYVSFVVGKIPMCIRSSRRIEGSQVQHVPDSAPLTDATSSTRATGAGWRRLVGISVAGLSVVLGLTGCATTPSPETSGRPPGSGNGKVITAAASINAWGSLLSQLGGTHVHASSIISNPATDPHD